MKSFLFLLLTLLFSFQTGKSLAKASTAEDVLSIQNLRCESKRNPLGIDVPNPRLSWVLQSDQRGQRQSARRILVATSPENLQQNIGDAWDSGKVNSSQSIQIPYHGKVLQSDRKYFWKVRVWDRDGKPMPWSAPAFWSTGLLHVSDWQAKWIGLDKAVGDDQPNAEHTRLSARRLHREFTMKKKIKRATAFVCGLGLFELYLNGEKIGDQVLAPALSEYNKRAYYMTFDVTKNLHQGANAVATILGNGRFFAPRHDSPTMTKSYGFPKLLLQINVQYDDGTSETIISDENWKLTTDGPIRANNEYDGEIYDARKEMPGWSEPGFNDAGWQKAELVEKPSQVLSAQPNEPIKVMDTLHPVAVFQPKPGMFIFDMGQNMVGWVRLKVKGKRGQKVTLRFAEVLRDDGTLYLDNIRSAKVTDVYILKGGATETWEPRFTYHGFRYVEMKGYPGQPDLSSIEGRVVYNAVETTGQFSCSNALINQIYKNAFWGIRGNYRSMPTDCPQRDERQGWLGDRSAESKGESFIFNIENLYNKWLVDIQDAQLQNGSLPNVAPSYWPSYTDNTTWPGSYIIIPNMLYEQYDDLGTLKKHYPSMKKWIRHMRQYLQDGIMPRDTYGDWCVPPVDLKAIHTSDPNRTTSGEFIGTAYFYHELELMQRFATLLHKTVDADSFRSLADKMKTAFNEKFLDKTHVRYGNNSQTSNVLALRFGLVPKKYRERVFENLLEKIMGESKGHIGTGLIGCQWLMRVLTNNGRPDIAYTLAAQNTYPSWGYMVGHGATTIWELWNGDTGDPAMNSHNHVMLLGDLIVWLYEDLAGIKADPEKPAFKHIVMRPQPVGDLQFVNADFHSMSGQVKSEWKIKNKKFHWNVSIPANTMAKVFIPATGENVVY
ncbi:MAG: family 78 glycoside hydrolase catalytic domain, partial [Actinobacteria bacterium]|nr:family 78 glycoside hydrolase catalytic domain [Actinomycetota bacterium]